MEYKIGAIVNDLTETLEERTGSRGLQCRMAVSQELPYLLCGDGEQLKQMLLHLILNAVKYTDKGAVTMSVNCEKKSEGEVVLKFRIADTGCGIKEEELEKLREKLDSHIEVSSVYGKGSIFSLSMAQSVKYWDASETFFEQLQQIPGIDTATGIQACGTREIYQQVVETFYDAAMKQADLIEELQRTEDYKNYTIQVHALKSSARLIGALGLSEHARRLEECGRAEDTDTIRNETPQLLLSYRTYAEQLKPLFVNLAEEDTKPMLEEKMLREALTALSEAVEVFDFDSADGMMNTLSKYRIPEHFQKKYQQIKTYMAEVARDDIMEIIKEYLVEEEH